MLRLGIYLYTSPAVLDSMELEKQNAHTCSYHGTASVKAGRRGCNKGKK